MRTTAFRNTLLALAAVALLAPATADSQVLRRNRDRDYDRYDDRYRGDGVAAELEKMARQVHRQARDYHRGERGERVVMQHLQGLEGAARAFNRSGGDERAFERLADSYFLAADALGRVRYRAHVYGGFNRVDQLMDELFDRYGYRSREFSRDRFGRDRGRFRDRPRDRWRY
ncbi:MAG TPA: hypothetical protein VF121_03915 [Thermoanaerobaculia bacterium]|nr:hypothetical protein [Thermoanaerobaculia bacterium]